MQHENPYKQTKCFDVTMRRGFGIRMKADNERVVCAVLESVRVMCPETCLSAGRALLRVVFYRRAPMLTAIIARKQNPYAQIRPCFELFFSSFEADTVQLPERCCFFLIIFIAIWTIDDYLGSS